MRPGFGPIELADGTQITVPQDFIVYEQPDPLCEARMVVQRPGKGGWISAQFVGLVTKTPPSAVLLTALASREHLDFRDPLSAERWLRAKIDQESARSVAHRSTGPCGSSHSSPGVFADRE